MYSISFKLKYIFVKTTNYRTFKLIVHDYVIA